MSSRSCLRPGYEQSEESRGLSFYVRARGRTLFPHRVIPGLRLVDALSLSFLFYFLRPTFSQCVCAFVYIEGNNIVTLFVKLSFTSEREMWSFFDPYIYIYESWTILYTSIWNKVLYTRVYRPDANYRRYTTRQMRRLRKNVSLHRTYRFITMYSRTMFRSNLNRQRCYACRKQSVPVYRFSIIGFYCLKTARCFKVLIYLFIYFF